jgi:predicted dehydrogenase
MAGGIHDVDALRMLIGEVETVSLFQARSIIPEMEGDDTSAAILKFVNGAVGVVTESFSTKTFRRTHPSGCPSIINGSLGTITVHQDEIELYGEKTGADKCLRIKVPANDTFLEETKHFIECIQTDTEPITSGEEERRSLAVILAGYESLKKGGTPIKVKH